MLIKHICINKLYLLQQFINFYCRETRNAEQDSYNVYFMKHENRTWSRKELCYIETTAHKHPELNVYNTNFF